MLGAGLMLTLVPIQGALDPEKICFLDSWMESVQKEDEQTFWQKLKLFLGDNPASDSIIARGFSLRTNLVSMMTQDNKPPILEKLEHILLRLDEALVNVYRERLGDRNLQGAGQSLAVFSELIQKAYRNDRLMVGLTELRVHLAEVWVSKVDEFLHDVEARGLSEGEKMFLRRDFMLRLKRGDLYSEKELADFAIQIFEETFPFPGGNSDSLEQLLKSSEGKERILRTIIGDTEPGMALRVAEDGKSLESFRPAGSIVIKASLSKPFTTNPSASGWFPIPIDSCSDPSALSSQDHAVVVPVDGVWLVMGKLYYANLPSVGRVCIRISRNDTCLTERTIYCAREGQSYQSIDTSGIFELKRGDKLTVLNYDSLSKKNPVKLLEAILSAVFLKEHY